MSMEQLDVRHSKALAGEILFGDDFSDDEIAEWFQAEESGYFQLAEADRASLHSGIYEFEQLAQLHAFERLPRSAFFQRVLGVGSARGHELMSVLPMCGDVTILEPADGFVAASIGGKSVQYIKPVSTGEMPFEDNSFDLIVAFSVLHHIPNVSKVLREMYRVAKPGGYVLLREPTHSMGDWREPRRGLTARERGIPLTLFEEALDNAGFVKVSSARCVFSLLPRFQPLARSPIWTYRWIARLDQFLCALPIWSDVYHATRLWHRFRPTSVAFVLRKAESRRPASTELARGLA